MKKSLCTFFALLIVAAMLAGCAAPAAQPAAQPTTAPAAAAQPAAGEPKTGGVLRTTMDQDPITSLDPTVPFNNSSIWTILNIYDQFFRVSKDGKSVDPDAAEKWEVSDDGLVYTITMRQGMTFSDGSPVTIEDVVFSSERMLASENWGFLFPEGTLVAAGEQPNTVVFTLEKPNAPFINDLAGFWSSIVPKKLVEEQGEKFWERPIGSGPFMIKEWVQGGTITLVRNPHYWDKPYPYLDEVSLAFIPDDNARMTQFQAGELDVALYVPYSQIETIDTIEGASVQTSLVYGLNMLDLSTTAEPMDDVRVRQALNYATDKQAIIDAVLFGHGEKANVLWPKVLYWSPELQGLDYDLEKAKQLMAEAGVADGFDLTILVPAGDQVREQIDTILIDQWSKIGVRVTLEAVDSTTQNERFTTNNFMAMNNGYTSDVIDPSELNFIFLCFYTQDRNGSCNDEVDQLAAQADQEMDPAKREQIYHDLMEKATQWAINIPLFYAPSRTAMWDYVKGFEVLPTANFRLWEVWMDK